MPITEYRNRQRLERFFALRDEGIALTQAAFQSGFGSYQQFFRVYRSATGLSPSHKEMRRTPDRT